MASTRKENHVSFRADDDFAEQLKEWADAEELTVADFVRKLVRVAAGIYRESGSLHELKRKFGEDPPKGKVHRGSA